MGDEATSAKDEGKPYKIIYYRSPMHRYAPADGVWLGLNGAGRIILNFFNDSPALPTKMVTELGPDGRIFTSKPPEMTYEDAGSVRQFEVSITLSLTAAKALFKGLEEFIKLGEADEKARQAATAK